MTLFRDFSQFHLKIRQTGSTHEFCRMENSGLDEVLNKTFSGSKKMFSGKKFLMNLGALRMVVKEFLRNDIQKLLDCDKLSRFIDDVSKRKATDKH